jgi:hypothetical protein
MVTYAQRPDGLLDVTLDDGRVLPMALDPAQLPGATPAQARQGLYANVTARPPATRVGTEGLAGPIQANPVAPGNVQTFTTQVNPAAAALAGEPSTDPADVAKRAEAARIEANKRQAENLTAVNAANVAAAQNLAAESAGPTRLVSATAQPEAAPAATAAPESEVDRLTRAYLASQLQPRGGGRPKPAQDVRSSFTVERELTGQVSPETAEDLAEARIDAQLMKQKQTDEQQAEKAGLAKLAAEEAVQAQDMIEQTQIRKAGIERDVSERMKRIDDSLAKARELADRGTARDRVFEDKGWFGRIVAGLGLALGRFATGAGGPNFAQQVLDEEVANEAQRQKDLVSIGEGEGTQLDRMLKVWGTPAEAEEMLRLQLKEHALQKAKAWALRSGSEQVQTNFDAWLAEEALRQQEARAAFEQKSAGKVVEQWKHVPASSGGGSGAPDPLKAVKRAAEFKKAMAEVAGTAPDKDAEKRAADLTERYVEGHGYAPSGTEGAKIRGTLSQLDEAESIVTRMQDARKKLREGGNPIDLRADLETMKGSLQTVSKNVDQLGALDKGSIEVSDRTIGKPEATISVGLSRAGFETPADRKLETYKATLAEKRRALTSSLSAGPAPPGYKPAKSATPSSFTPK